MIQLLHPRLPNYIRTNYSHKIITGLTIMDFNDEILSKAKEFIHEIENPPMVAAVNSEQLMTVKVDNATSFLPLIDNKDHELNKLQIKVKMTDSRNKNENAVVDKACAKLKVKLKRVEPDGNLVSRTVLQLAISRLNNKLSGNKQISAFEIHFNRDMYTGNNLNLDYEKLRNEQVNERKIHNESYLPKNKNLQLQVIL